MNVSSARVTLAAVGVLPLVACHAAPPFRDGVYVTPELFPGAVAGDRGPFLARLVDDLTGEPLAGAEVFHVAESKTPIAGEFWWTRRGVSDADGFVRMDRPNGNRDWHVLVVRHPSCGVAACTGRGENVVRFGRGFDVPVRITDWLGQPQPGAKVGFCGYCGHSPDLVWATADRDGIAVLRGIDAHQNIADLYVQHPGLHFFYNNVDWRPGDPPAEVRCAFVPAQTGRVVDHRGKPVAGAYVCGGGKHRGPWARTAADGSFAVLGAQAGESPHQIVVGDREIHVGAEAGQPVLLHLPEPDGKDVGHGTAEPMPGSAPVATEPATRRSRVVVDGAPGTVQVEATWPALDEPVAADADGYLELPATAPFLLSLTAANGEECGIAFPTGSTAEELRVRWLPIPRVRGRCVDASGAPCAGFVRCSRDGAEIATDADGRFDLVAPGKGWLHLEVRAAAASVWWGHAVRVGGPGSADVDLGALRVAGPAPLVVVDARGEPLCSAKVGLVRAGWRPAGEPLVAALDAEGAWRGLDLRPGDGIVVERDGCVPFRTVLVGDGPHRIVVPDGQLDLEVVGEGGQALAATVVVADHDAHAADGRIALRGMRHGPTTLWISSPGHRSVEVGVVVGGGARSIRALLPARE